MAGADPEWCRYAAARRTGIPILRALSTRLAGFDASIFAFIDDLRRRGEIAEGQFPKYRYAVRHFLIWLELTGIALKTVDATVIDRFLRHDCRCAASSAPVRPRRWRKGRTSPKLMTFIRFLERTGRIETPGELDDNFQLLDAFLAGLRRGRYATATIKLYRYGCAGLIVWLHLSRIRLRDLTPDIYARFRNRQFVCSIPGSACSLLSCVGLSVDNIPALAIIGGCQNIPVNVSR